MGAEEKRSRMRLLRQIVKDHNVHRWIRSFLQAIPSAEPGSSASGSTESGKADSNSDSWSRSFALKVRADQKMPGVALVASALTQRRRPIYAVAKDAKLRVLGTAAGED